MQKIAIVGLVGMLMISPIFSEAALPAKAENISAELAVKSLTDKGKRNKNGAYRKKKGFLWGIFKKKSQCDCPKH